MSRAGIYLEIAYNKLRSAGIALAVASILLILGTVVLAVGAASYKVYVNPQTGEVVPNATRADVEAGIVVEETRMNTTMAKMLLTSSLSDAGSLLVSLGGEGKILYKGYANALLFFAALAALAASINLRGAAIVFRDYARIFRAGVFGGSLKVIGSIILLYSLWQISGAISEGSDALLLGALGFYYVGGLLMLAGAILIGVPTILAAQEIQSSQLVRPAASLHMLGALITFLTTNTIQLIVGPLFCLAAGVLFAISSTKTLKAIR